MPELRVSEQGSILAPGGVLLRPGTMVTRGALTDAMIREHLRAGFLVALDKGKPVGDAKVPGAEEVPVVGQDNIGQSASAGGSSPSDIEAAMKPSEEGRIVVPGASVEGNAGAVSQELSTKTPPPGEEPLRAEGKWNVNPAALTGKSLDTLNLMVIGRDPSVTPFETVEEAAAFLTQDFVPPPE